MGAHIKYKINYNFNNIKTKEQAYCFGILQTDGCNHIYENRRFLSLGLHTRDEDIIKIFKNTLGFSGPIKRYEYKSFKSKSLNITPISKVVVSDQKNICENLLKLGCPPRKSKSLKFKQLNENLMSSYFRGIIDGDGSITFDSNKKDPYIFICSGSRHFANECYKFIKNKFNFGCLYEKNDKFYIKIHGRKSFFTFCKWLYKNSKNSRGKRKYNKFLKIKKILNV